MVSIRPDYDYHWNRGNDVAELTAALAVRMKASHERIENEDINVEMISLVLLRIYKDWWIWHKADLELQALFAVAAACEWIWQGDQERLFDLLEMLDEVGNSHFEDYFSGKGRRKSNEFTADGLRLAVSRALGAAVHCVTLEPYFIEVAFTDGNYGTGLFDGRVCLNYAMNNNDGELCIINDTKSERHDFLGASLPRTDEELEESLASDLWKYHPRHQTPLPRELRSMQRRLLQDLQSMEGRPSPSRLPLEDQTRQIGDVPTQEIETIGATERNRYLPLATGVPPASSQYYDSRDDYYDECTNDSRHASIPPCYSRETRQAKPSQRQILPSLKYRAMQSPSDDQAENDRLHYRNRLPAIDSAIKEVGYKRATEDRTEVGNRTDCDFSRREVLRGQTDPVPAELPEHEISSKAYSSKISDISRSKIPEDSQRQLREFLQDQLGVISTSIPSHSQELENSQSSYHVRSLYQNYGETVEQTNANGDSDIRRNRQLRREFSNGVGQMDDSRSKLKPSRQ